VNILAISVGNEYLQSMREQSWTEQSMRHLQAISAAEPSLRERIAATVVGLRRLVASPASSGRILPQLEDYPYRS
jgi:hypothetical protein